VVVLSRWHGAICTGSFHLSKDDVPSLIDALVEGLVDGYHQPHPASAIGGLKLAEARQTLVGVFGHRDRLPLQPC